MKADIHPKYEPCVFTCAGCGTAIETRSTAGSLTLAVCSSCHPFFTGKHKLVDTAGRVERFRRKYNIAPPTPEELEAAEAKAAAAAAAAAARAAAAPPKPVAAAPAAAAKGKGGKPAAKPAAAAAKPAAAAPAAKPAAKR